MTTRTLLAATVVLLAVAYSASAADRLPYPDGEATLVQEAVFSGEDAPENAVMFLVGGFDVDRDGNVYATDMKTNCIKKFGPSGELLATIGSEGGGPGDLRRPGSLVVCANGDLVVSEYGNHRVQRLTQDGEHMVTWLSSQAATADVAPDGTLYARVFVSPGRYPPPPEATMRVVRFVNADDSTVTLDEMTAVWSVVWGNASAYRVTMAPYPAALFWGVLPDGNVVVGHGDTNRFRILAPDGSTLQTVTIDEPRGKVTDALEEKYWDRQRGDGTIDPNLQKAVVFPEWLPYYSDILIDDAGRILVRWGVPEDEHAVFFVFDESGERLARLTVGGLPRSLRFRGGKLYALRGYGFKELPTITRYAIQ